MSDYSVLIKSKLQEQLGDPGEFKGYFEVNLTPQRCYDQVKHGLLGDLSKLFTFTLHNRHYNGLRDLALILLGYKKRGWIIVTDQGLHFVQAKVRKRGDEAHIEYKNHISFPFAELSHIHAQDQMTEVDLIFSHRSEGYIVKLEGRFFIYRQLIHFLNHVISQSSSSSEESM